MGFSKVRRAGALALMCGAILTREASAQAPQQPAPAAPQAAPAQTPIPSPQEAAMIARNTLIALNQAILTQNFDVLHALSAPQMQKDVDAKKLGEAFAGFRERNIDLSPAAVFALSFAPQSGVDQQGLLRLVGFVPTQPLRITFNLAYARVDNRWRAVAINVDATPAPPDQAQPQQPAAPAPAKPAVAQPRKPPPKPAPKPAAKPAPAAAPAKPAAPAVDRSTDPPTTRTY
jgi:hypothetical protein